MENVSNLEGEIRKLLLEYKQNNSLNEKNMKDIRTDLRSVYTDSYIKENRSLIKDIVVKVMNEINKTSDTETNEASETNAISEEYKGSSSQKYISPESLQLEYGDVIQIISPTNEDLHNKVFFIHYIDETQIHIINDTTIDKFVLDIVDGSLTDKSIESIIVLDKPEEKGFARQNNLIPGKWIQIEFGGDIPTMLTGKITDLEEDQIEIQMYPENTKIYIDFGYKGIPLNIPIESIQLREEPIEISEKKTRDMKEKEIDQEDVEPLDSIEHAEGIEIPKEDVEQVVKEVIAEADEIVFGDELEEISYEVQISEEKKRYSIQEQSEDLLNDILSTIPNMDRTSRVLNRIHIVIERFQQLRKDYSVFNTKGFIEGFKKLGANYKPLVDKLTNLNKKLYWLLPVVKLKNKIYNEEGAKNDDTTVYLDLAEVRKEVSQIQYDYYSNTIPNGENKYKYLMNALVPYFKSFENYETNEEIIDNIETNTNILGLIDNISMTLQDFYANVVSKDTLRKRRFVTQSFNLGLKSLEAEQFTGVKMVAKRVNLTPNDSIPISSFIMLPEAYVKYSHINLPNTNIYTKVNLNQSQIEYWRLLKRQTNITSDIIEDLGSQKEYEGSNFLDSILHISLDDSLNEDDVYRKFLQSFIPRTRELFELVKKYIQNPTSFVKVVEYLEPFMVYTKDITFKQYQDVLDFIVIHVKKLKQHIVSNSKTTTRLKTLKMKIFFSSSILENIFTSNELKQTVLESYFKNHAILSNRREFEKVSILMRKNKIFTGEIISSLLSIDYGDFYSILFKQNFHSLRLGKDVFEEAKQMVEQLYSNQNNALEGKIQSQDNKSCITKSLVKEYSSIEELNADEDTMDVYVDKKYDDTVYDILDEYKREYDAMERDQFVSFLTRKLVEVNGVPEDKALYLARTIVAGKKRVQEGDYAMLKPDFSQPQFYERRGQKWIPDTSLNREFSIFNNENDPTFNGHIYKYFCNTKPKCLELNTHDGIVEDKCSSLDVNNEYIIQKQYEQMMNSIVEDDEYYMDDSIQEIRAKVQLFRERVELLKDMNYNMQTKNTRNKHSIGMALEVIETEHSPYTKLLHRILGVSDLKDKMTLIKKFIAEFTRPANVIEGEDIYFYYCIITNTKLVPTFYSTLADGFFNDTYRQSIEFIEKNQGILSDDGDKIVDKYSGHTIRMIDLFEEEEFDESGFRVVSRDIMEEDPMYEPVDFNGTETSKLFSRNDANMVLNIIQSTSSYIGITIEDQKEYMVRLILEYSYSSIGDKDKYEAKMKEESKRGKKILSYSRKLHQFFIFYSGLILHIIIQTSIPSKKTRKTFPGCIRSFGGFPLDEDETNTKGITYICCVMKKITSSQKPWNSILKLKEEQLVKNMVVLYTKVVSKNGEILSKIQEKRAYAKDKGEDADGIPNEYNVDIVWKRFLPYLYTYHISSIESISDDFKEQLMQNLKIGNSLSRKQLDMLQTKLYSYSLKIQESIQQLIHKERPILETNNGEPFIENVCCNDEMSSTTLKYFVNKNSKIQDYLTKLKTLDSIQNTIHRYTKGHIVLNTLDLKNKYPDMKNEFSETTIYQTFIKYCRFDTNKPLNNEIYSLCGENKSKLENSDTLEEKIRILKSEGKEYSKENMKQLLKIVNRMNLLYIDINNHSNRSCKYVVQYKKLIHTMSSIESKELDILKDFNSIYKTQIVDTILQEKIKQSTYDALKNGMKNTINFLITKKEEHYTQVQSFLQEYLNVSNNEKSKIFNILNTLTKSRFKESDETDEVSTLKDNTQFVSINNERKIQLLRTVLDELLYIFPNMITELNLSLIESSIKIPKHWNLSQLHQNDIKQFLVKSLKPLNSFGENKVLLSFLNDLKYVFQPIQGMLDTLFLYDTFILHRFEFETNTEIESFIHKHVDLFNIHLYEYLFIYFIHYIIEKVETFDIHQAMSELHETNQDIRGNDDGGIDYEGKEDEILQSKDILEGDTFTLKKDVANMLYGYIQVMGNQFKVIHYSKKEILKLVNRSKEKEKDIKTRTLKELTDEERKVDNELKSAKLGIWNIGLQKGLTQYVKGTYDEERENMEKEARIDKKLGEINDVTLMNRDIYSLDIIDEEQIEEQIENEAYDIGNLPEDDDHGDNEGDEMYY